MERFINLSQVKLSVNDFVLKFTLLSKHDPSLVADPRDLMNRIRTGANLVEKECHMTMLVDDKDISRLIMFTHKIEESILKKEMKRRMMENKGFDRYGCYKNRQKFARPDYSSTSRYENERVSNPRPQGKVNNCSQPTFPACGKKYEDNYFAGRDGCYGCGESCHMIKDWTKPTANVRVGKKVASNKVEDVPQGNNRFNALRSKVDPE